MFKEFLKGLILLGLVLKVQFVVRVNTEPTNLNKYKWTNKIWIMYGNPHSRYEIVPPENNCNPVKCTVWIQLIEFFTNTPNRQCGHQRFSQVIEMIANNFQQYKKLPPVSFVPITSKLFCHVIFKLTSWCTNWLFDFGWFCLNS